MGKMKNRRWLSVMLVLMVCFTMVTSVLPVSAAGFSGAGKGTKSNPYLVTNAQQLDEMRNNLSAHYKLANTIDMSSVSNFTPIGNVATPFKGTFTCDTNSDGTPKHVIKNLKITVGEEHKDLTTVPEWQAYYKKDGTSGWEAGLFGKAVNATFKNIVLLDVNITNWVVGGSNMGSNWEIYNGQDDQGTAALVALGEGITVTGCGATGKVTGRTNNVAGLVGMALSSSKIKNSYSYVTVDGTGGVWNAGGLLAVINGTVDSCFYNGTFKGTKTSAGAFFGCKSGTAKVTNCWAAGTVKTEASGCFGGTKVLPSGDSWVDSYTYCENTYTIATIEGRKNAQTNKTTESNNWITDAVGGLEIGYAAGSQSEINSAFKNLSAWTVKSGTYPQLKNVHPVTDASKYVPVKADATDSVADSTETTTDKATDKTTDKTEDKTTDKTTDKTEDKTTEETADNVVDETTGEVIDETTGEVTDETTGENETEEQQGDTIQTTVEVDSDSVTAIEKLLLIVLGAIFIILAGAIVFTLVSNLLFIKKCKEKETTAKSKKNEE